MSKLNFFFNYSNYYNRKVYTDVLTSDFNVVKEKILEKGAQLINPFTTQNFIPGDGVNTVHIINSNLINEVEAPDYCIVCDDTNTEIKSRWFVISAHRTRKGQYELRLKRDSVSDNWNNIINSPVYIEKGMLHKDNNLIYNREDMSFNQIKNTQELLLKDKYNIPWIVGYVAAPQNNEETTEVQGSQSQDINELTTNIDNWISSHNVNKQYIRAEANDFYVQANVKGENTNLLFRYSSNLDGTSVYHQTTLINGRECYWKEKTSVSQEKILFSNAINDNDIYNICLRESGNVYPYFNEIVHASTSSNVDTNVYPITNSQLNNITQWDNYIVKDTSSDKIYRCKYVVEDLEINGEFYVNSSTPDLQTASYNVMSSAFSRHTGEDYFNLIVYPRRLLSYRLVLEEIDYPAINFKVNISRTRAVLNDSPYCMFAIPYGDCNIKTVYGNISIDPSSSLAVARSIAEKLTSQKCYDIQLLPYNPIRYMSDLESNKLVIDTTLETIGENGNYNFVTTGTSDTVINIVCWAIASKFSFNLEQNLPEKENEIDFKIACNTDFIRICSPNYASEFEMSVEKNRGIDYFIIDCYYKPFSPYIHVAPNFKGLYGIYTGDARGLVCAGEFSLPQSSDAWAQYQLNNKNYEKSFQRNIRTMEKQRDWSIAESSVGVLGTAASGAASGAAVGGLYGAAVGGIVGLVQGGLNLAETVDLRNEALNNTKDQFKYQLGNVQALPDTLTKIDAFTNNNKIFPFIEFYTCTNEEKEALRNKIKFNGMKVNVIDNISNYFTNPGDYVKGSLIRLENSKNEYNEVNDIANELFNGIFVY